MENAKLKLAIASTATIALVAAGWFVYLKNYNKKEAKQSDEYNFSALWDKLNSLIADVAVEVSGETAAKMQLSNEQLQAIKDKINTKVQVVVPEQNSVLLDSFVVAGQAPGASEKIFIELKDLSGHTLLATTTDILEPLTNTVKPFSKRIDFVSPGIAEGMLEVWAKEDNKTYLKVRLE